MAGWNGRVYQQKYRRYCLKTRPQSGHSRERTCLMWCFLLAKLQAAKIPAWESLKSARVK
jgi:hypothetical protein